MRHTVWLATFLGSFLPFLTVADKVALKPVKADFDIDNEEMAEEEELDLEKEIFGPQVERFVGINILDKDMNVVLSDPSEKVLKALAEPGKKENSLNLEKVKAMYQDHIEKQQRESSLKKAAYSQRDFENMLAEEQNIAKKEKAADETVLQKVINLFW
ncbi:hypothetical protein SK128_004560 [Halocaridina rubra]|uniref:Uncharacterized protein n=1 Tax=Halocaridina rubra TaxID=373956 RepID=A0AAN8WN05_HALRR